MDIKRGESKKEINLENLGAKHPSGGLAPEKVSKEKIKLFSSPSTFGRGLGRGFLKFNPSVATDRLKKLKNLFNTKKKKILFSLLLILLIIIPLSFFFLKKQASASWWDEAWHYRKSIPLTNSSGSTLTDFQIKVLDNYDLSADVTASKIQSDLDDLRFTNSSGIILDYWIEDSTNSSVDVWIKNPSLIAGSSTIYMYYGNPQALAYSDGNKVFDFFDDFNDGNIDTSKWVMQNLGSGGSSAETSGQLQLTSSNNLTGSANAKTVKTFSNNVAIEWRRYDTEQHYNDLSFGYGNVVAEDGSTAYWHTTAQYGYFNKIQDDGNFIYNRISNGAASNMQASIDGPNSGQWIKYKNVYSSAGLWQWSYDTGAGYTLLGTGQTDVTYLSDEKYILLSRGGYSGSSFGGTSQYDYIFVRKYVTTQPTAGTFGSEEKSPAPVGYWSFDEGYGTTTYDSSSNKKNGTITGATWKNESECVSGKCLYFNGLATTRMDAVTHGNNMTSLTACAWIKPNALTNVGNDSEMLIMSRGFSFWIKNDGLLKVWIPTTSAYPSFTTADPISINEWQYVCAVYGGIGIAPEIYINGKNMSGDGYVGGGTLLDNSTVNFRIGAGGTNEYFGNFYGSIDEPKIYDYARTADQIKADFAAGSAGQGKISEGSSVTFGSRSESWLTDGLVGYWKMDETSGTTVTDSSGNNNTGTLTNAQETGTSDSSGNTTTSIIDTDGTLSTTDDTYNGMIFRSTSSCGGMSSNTERLISDYTGATKTFSITPALPSAPDNCPYEIKHQANGKYGSGINFDGVDDYIVIPDGSDFYQLANTKFAVSTWIKLPTIGSTKYVFSLRGNVNRGWDLRVTSAGGIYFGGFGVTGCYGQTADGVLSDNNWHQIALTRDNYSYRVYIDGSEKLLVHDVIGPPSYGTGNLYIGAVAPSAGLPTLFSSQYIDETRIYNRALSPDEVRKLYEYAPGPVAHWKMDERVSGDAKTLNDISGNNNVATTVDGANNTGMDCSQMGKYGSACSFDGADDYVNIVNNGALNNTDSITISAWIKPNAFTFSGGATGIFGKGSSYYQDYFLGLNSGELRFVIAGDFNGSNDVRSSTGSIVLNEWTYASVVFNQNSTSSSTLKFYINGKLNTSHTLSISRLPNSSSNIRIGFRGSDYPFNGLMDDVKVYNYARTQEQILEDMSADNPAIKSPVLDLSFDEGQGATAYDKSVSKNNGTLNSGAGGTNPTATAMWEKNGKFGGAMEFDGTNDYVNAGPNIDLANKSFTISSWAKRNAINIDHYIAGQGTGSGGANVGLHFGFRSGTNTFTCAFFSNDLNTPLGYTDLNWHHWVCAYDADTNLRTIYRDGVAVASGVATADYQGSGVFNIGARYSTPQNYFNGLIDEFKIYNYSLSEDEIKTLYNGGSAMAMGGESASANNNGTTVTGDAAKYCVPGDSAKCDKPILEMDMDEMSGTTTYDKSGNGFNGTINGEVVWNPLGKKGSALDFNGTNDYLEIPDDYRFTFNNGTSDLPFTLSAWIYYRAPGGDENNPGGSIMSKYINNSPFNGEWSFGITTTSEFGTAGTDQLYFQILSHATTIRLRIKSVSPLPRNQWVFVTATYDGSKLATGLNLYKNGVLMAADRQTQGTYIGMGNYSSPVNIGAVLRDSGVYNAHTDGIIDEARIYNYARTPSQIAWDYNQGAPMVHWKMDESQGTQVDDWSGSGNHATMTNMDATTDRVEGKNNKALDFDGSSNDRVISNSNVDLSTTDKISTSFWFKFTDGSTPRIMLEHSVDFNSNNAFMIDNSETGNGSIQGSFNFGDHCGSQYNVTYTNNAYNDGVWHHFVGTIDRSLGINQNKMYIDGALAPFTQEHHDYNCSGNFGSYPFYIGGRASGLYDYLGQIDDVKIYNYALTPLQVQLDYNNSSAVNFR